MRVYIHEKLGGRATGYCLVDVEYTVENDICEHGAGVFTHGAPYYTISLRLTIFASTKDTIKEFWCHQCLITRVGGLRAAIIESRTR